MSDATDAWRARWQILARCRDCDTAFECERPDLSLERLGGFSRAVLVNVPEVCPECKNLKVAK